MDRDGGNGIELFHQFLIVADVMFGEKVYGGDCPFQILNGRPALVFGTLRGVDIVLNVKDNIPVALSGLSEGPGGSDDPGTAAASSVQLALKGGVR